MNVCTTSAWIPAAREFVEGRTSVIDFLAEALGEQYRLAAIGPFHGPPSPPRRPQLVYVTGRPAGTYQRRTA